MGFFWKGRAQLTVFSSQIWMILLNALPWTLEVGDNGAAVAEAAWICVNEGSMVEKAGFEVEAADTSLVARATASRVEAYCIANRSFKAVGKRWGRCN